MFRFFYLTGIAAITASIMQDVEKPTISEVYKWDYTKRTQQVSMKATKLATKMDTMFSMNVNERTKCCAIELQRKDKIEKRIEDLGRTKCQPTRLAKQADLVSMIEK